MRISEYINWYGKPEDIICLSPYNDMYLSYYDSVDGKGIFSIIDESDMFIILSSLVKRKLNCGDNDG